MDITPKQLQLGRFWKKYLRLTRAGVPTLGALEIIAGEESSTEFQSVIQAMHSALADGNLLSEVMVAHPSFFSLSSLEMVRTAEKGGQWDIVVEELADGYLDGTFD
jgi:type IV pilus assembly protein PilC